MVVELTFKAGDGARLPCRAGQERTEYRETATGLRLRVTSKGARTWSLVYWSPIVRTTRRYRIGDGAVMPLSQARARARAVLHAVEQEGRDPQAERVAAGAREREARKARAEERRRAAEERKRRSVTFGQLCEQYVEHRRTKVSGAYNRPARQNTLHNWAGLLKNYILPGLGKRPPEDITSEHIIAVLEAAVERGGPTVGPRVRELMSAVWRWMEQRRRTLGVQLPSVSPFLGLPTIGTTNERERELSPVEVWKLWRATEDEGREGAALKFMLLTAARVREVTDLHVSELDLPASVWRLPAARNKGGRDRLIPLSPQATALVRALPPCGDGHPFGAEHKKLPLVMDRVRARMGAARWQARDLRRTSATRCGILGADPFVVSLVLGHARDEHMPAVTRTYLRHEYEPLVRAALDRLGAWVDDTVSRTTEPGDVVAIGARR